MKKLFILGMFLGLVFAGRGFSQDNMRLVGSIRLSSPYASVGNYNTINIFTDENNNVVFASQDNKILLTKKDKADTIQLFNNSLDLMSKNSNSNFYKFLGTVFTSEDYYRGFISLAYINQEEKKTVSMSILLSYMIFNFLLEEYKIKEVIEILNKSVIVSDNITAELKKIQ